MLCGHLEEGGQEGGGIAPCWDAAGLRVKLATGGPTFQTPC